MALNFALTFSTLYFCSVLYCVSVHVHVYVHVQRRRGKRGERGGGRERGNSLVGVPE